MLFKTRTLVIIAIVVIVICALMYGYLYMRDGGFSMMHKSSSAQPNAPMGFMGTSTMAKVGATERPDGTYTAIIRSIMTTSEDTVITFGLVTTSGTKVKDSGEDLKAPVTATTKVTLKDKADATVKDLSGLVRTKPPVFTVTTVKGNVSTIVEE